MTKQNIITKAATAYRTAGTGLLLTTLLLTDEQKEAALTVLEGVFNEEAFAFYNSLTEEQLATVYQGESVANLTYAPGAPSNDYGGSVEQNAASGMGGGAPSGMTPPSGAPGSNG